MYDNVKLLTDDEGYQLVPIPDEYRFDTEDVFVNGLGECVTIAPLDKIQEDFTAAAALLSEDFMIEEYPDERFEASGTWDGKERGYGL